MVLAALSASLQASSVTWPAPFILATESSTDIISIKTVIPLMNRKSAVVAN